jgi:ATP-dependent Clp endopeptidase proteolytic subunit ClpP
LKALLALLHKVLISKVEGVYILRTILFSGPSTVHFSSAPSPELSSVRFGRAVEPVKETQDAFQHTKPNHFSPQPSLESTIKSLIYLFDPFAIGHRFTFDLYAQQMLHGRTKLELNHSPEPFDIASLSLIDSLNILPHPVDVSVKSTAQKAGLAALLHTRGLSSMLPQARITIDPPKDGSVISRQTNSDVQQKIWFNDSILNQLIATEWIEKAGMQESDRESLLDLLKGKNGRQDLNPLQLLQQGQKGAIDYIEVGLNRGVTRQDLDNYIKEKDWDKKQVQEFIRDAHHVYQIPSRPLNEIFPQQLLSPTPKSNSASASQTKPPALYELIEKDYENPTYKKRIPSFHKVISESRDEAIPSRMIENPDQNLPSILHNDGIFFSTDVAPHTINHLGQALSRLDRKRQDENSLHHIPLYLSSPGGNITSGYYFTDLLKRIKTPVDVIVNGLACSAGATYILTGATGMRLATPHSLLMLHEHSSIGKFNAHDMGRSMKAQEENKLRLVSERTGRPFDQLRLDTKQDYWLNPLEALFYGSKGMLDGVVVGTDGLVTREDAMVWLIKKMGSQEIVEKHIQERLERRRDMNAEMDHKFDVNDPFDNFPATLEAIAAETGRKLGKSPGFTESGPHPKSSAFEHVLIKDHQTKADILWQSLLQRK